MVLIQTLGDRNVVSGQHLPCQVASYGLPVARRALCFADCQVINRDPLINRSVQRIVIRTFSVMHRKQEEIQDTAEHFVVVELMNALSDLR